MIDFPYAIHGTVIRGFQKARKSGYPTANLLVKNVGALPHGIYLGRSAVSSEKKDLPSIVFFGIPYAIADMPVPRFEVHILNRQKLKLYALTMKVTLISYLRPNKRFSSLAQLKKAIAKDLQNARTFFGIN